MSEHDLLEVVEIEETCGLSRWGWDSYHNEFGSGDRVIMLVARNDARALSEEGKRIAGFIVSRLVADELHINNVAVRPEWQRFGIGTKLLRAVLRRGKQNGSQTAVLEVRASNEAAQALYRGCGFSPVGRRPDYYQDPVEDAVIMAVSLASGA